MTGDRTSSSTSGVKAAMGGSGWWEDEKMILENYVALG